MPTVAVPVRRGHDRTVLPEWAGRFPDALRTNAQEGFAFFNSHFEGMAPASVSRFRAELGMEPVRYELPSEA